MIFRVSFLVVASVAAFTVTRIKINCLMSRKTPNRKIPENDDTNFQQEQEEKDELKPNEPEKNDWISEFQLPDKNWNCVIEIEMLKDVVKKLEQRRETLEVKLLELYCLKQQQLVDVAQLRMSLRSKMVEIDMVNATINALQAEKKSLDEEIKQNQLAKKQLEFAKRKIVEMQGKNCVESAQMKGQLMMVKEQLLAFKMEETSIPDDDKVEKKLRAMKNVELGVLEMKRENKELQLEMRELTVKLVASQARIAALSHMTESKTIAEVEEEIRSLRHSNGILLEQVDKLQNNRFSIVEELVYQRWLKTCLRYEIQDYHTPQQKTPNRKLGKKVSFESQEPAKQPLVYTNFDSISSHSSSVESDQTTSTTITSYSSSQASIWRKYSLVHNIKRWGRRKDYSTQKGLIRRFSTSTVPSDSPTPKKNQVHGALESPEARSFPRVRRVSFSDSVKSAALPFQDIPKSLDRESGSEQITSTFYNSTSKMEEENEMVSKSGTVQTEDLHVGDQLMDVIAAAVIFFFIILLFYMFLSFIIH